MALLNFIIPGGLVSAKDNPMPAANPPINPPVVIKTCFHVFRFVVLKIAIPAPVAAQRPVIQFDVFFNFFVSLQKSVFLQIFEV